MKKARPFLTVFAVTALGFAACDKAEVVDGLGFRGVADIFVDADKGLLLTPNIGAGTLIVQKLP